jgi:branched-chain amino acid transport system ATP-binding protein
VSSALDRSPPPPDGQAPLLSVTGLHHWFGGLHVIDGVEFSCRSGIVKAIIGPNGAGKTTLLNLIAGSLRPAAGAISFDGRPTTGRPPHEIAARGISRTFQTTRLFPRMSVLENIMVGRHVRGRRGFFAGLVGPVATAAENRRFREESMAVLDRLGIAELAHRDAQSLPFGRQRVVEFARALASEPRLILLDEPACGLNPRETEEIGRLIEGIRARGITALIVEHDMSLVMGISDEVVVLSYGRKIAEGSPAQVQADPEVVSIYLGESDA